MKTFFDTIAAVLLIVGLIMMAGSDGMCGGQVCGPDYPPNSISDMLMYASIGLAFFATGAAILIRNQEEA